MTTSLRHLGALLVNNNVHACVAAFYSGEGSNQTTKTLLCLARQI
jgi:hypothetical protein